MTATNHTRLIRLSGAAAVVERITGERPHIATLHRWAQRGLCGVKLRTAFAGGHRRTTEQWIREFFDAVTAAHDGKSSQQPEASRSASMSREQAAAELAADGI